MIYGMASGSTYNYTAQTGKKCLLGVGDRVAIAGVTNFIKLPSNDYDSLMQAIATVGPVSISVDASWGMCTCMCERARCTCNRGVRRAPWCHTSFLFSRTLSITLSVSLSCTLSITLSFSLSCTLLRLSLRCNPESIRCIRR